ncbi:SDR family oxidoreductase [Streptomyces sp. ISL-11]|uniref:SDR family oxidoreductase n=1 Tax=Streptomyces sp. ISL-11 TaxID=2819174 RepID=UPI001BE63F10|nr:SDR family oxidoreductase [Streptomyces sp. ISL-11]MBT2386311.1 SDR family oxidoreductase [Streptomyces sp. ISL-11]
MAAHVSETQVIVVGAGPVGLMLAGELRLAGAEVTVLEQRQEPTTESRATTLHARTMEILDSRGLLEKLGTVPGQSTGHFGGIPLDLTLEGPYPGQWKVPQARIEELLAQWAHQLGARILRGHRVRELTVTDDHAEVTTTGPDGPHTWRAKCVVGCDGEESTVRRLGNFPFPGAAATRELLRADVAGITIADRRFERLPGGLAIAARRPDGTTRVMVCESGATTAPRTGDVPFTDIAAAWQRVTGEDITGGTPLWANAFTDACAQATTYRDYRLFLAGDAAHRQMPIGGQALNLGLQDALNLGWKLAAQVAGRGPDGVLDSYHRERHATGARTLANIRAQALFLLGGGEVDAARQVMTELLDHPRARTHLAGMISGLDIRYDTGDGVGDHPLLGLRLPHFTLATADGTTVTSTALLRTGGGLLIDLTGRTDPSLAATAAPWAPLVRTVTATTSGPAPAGALLVRPDGHIAWAGGQDTTDTAGLSTALTRWFGTPPPSTDTAPAPVAAPTTAPPATATSATAPTTNGSTPMGRLNGKTALVTGSSRGMGRATALRLAAEGALVAVHYTTGADAAAQTVATIENDGGRAFAIQAELGVPGDAHALFVALEKGLKERTGTTDLHILVNNAGVMGGVAAKDTTPEQFDRLVAVNAKAPFFLIQRALKNIPDGGRIINISSGLTRVANPEEIAYAMTKGAVEQLALHFAKLLGPRNITINSVAPGITRNNNPAFGIPEAVEQMAALSAFNRVGEPADVADVVAFLASEDARWITGAFLDATGGTLLG